MNITETFVTQSLSHVCLTQPGYIDPGTLPAKVAFDGRTTSIILYGNTVFIDQNRILLQNVFYK